MPRRKSDPPRRASRADKKLDKRDRIRNAAYELFVKHGFDETTVSQIAAKASVAKGTVFLYAGDKADLLFLVMHERLRETVERVTAGVPRPAPLLDQWMFLFRGLFEMYEEHPHLGESFVRALPGAQGPNALAVQALTFSFLAQIAALVAEAQAKGEVAEDIAPMEVAANVFSLYYGALLSWLTGYTDLDAALDPGLRRALALQIRGLGP